MKHILLPLLCCMASLLNAQEVSITNIKVNKATSNTDVKTKISSYENALIIINGAIADKEKMNAIDPKEINTVNIIKDSAAMVKYGEKGKAGVIEITTKNNIIVKVKNDAEQLPIDASNIKTYPYRATATKYKLPSDILYVIDGKVTTQSEINKLDPSKILTMDVLKGTSAVEKYGNTAASGAIEIFTKKTNDKVIENNIRDYFYFQRNVNAQIDFAAWQKLPETERFIIDMTVLDNRNTLFIGIHNPLRINISGKTNADIIVEINNQAQVFQNEQGDFVAQVVMPKNTSIIVKSKETGEVLATKEFKAVYLQPAQPYKSSVNQ